MKTILAILAAVCLVGCEEDPNPNIGTSSTGARERMDRENQKSLNTPQRVGKTADGGELWCVRIEPYRGPISYHTYVTYPKPKVAPPMPTPMPTYYKQTNVIVDGRPAFIQETFQGPQQ